MTDLIHSLRYQTGQLWAGVERNVNMLGHHSPEPQNAYEKWAALHHESLQNLKSELLASKDGAPNPLADEIVDESAKRVWARVTELLKAYPDKTVEQLESIVNSEAGARAKHGIEYIVGGLKHYFYRLFGTNSQQERHPLKKSRRQIIDSMVSLESKSSAISALMLTQIKSVSDKASAELRSNTERGNLHPILNRLVDDECVAVPQQGTPRLARRKALGDFAVKILDEFMKPTAGQLQADVNIVHEKARALRESITLLQAKVERAQKDKDAGRVTQAVVDEAKRSFGKKLTALVDRYAKETLSDSGGRALGLNEDQRCLLEHMHSVYAYNVFKYTATISMAASGAGFLNAIPGLDSASKAAIVYARAMTVFAANIATQEFQGDNIQNARGWRVYPNENLGIPNYSVVDKRLARIVAKDAGNILGEVTDAELEDQAKALIEKAQPRQQFAKLLRSPKNSDAAGALSRRAHTDFEWLLQAKNKLTEKRAALIKVAQGAESSPTSGANDLKRIDAILAILNGLSPNFGVAQCSDDDRFSGILSVAAQASEAANLTAGNSPLKPYDDLLGEIAHLSDTAIPQYVESNPIADDYRLELLLSDDAIARQVVMESEVLTRLTDRVTNNLYGHAKSDAALKATVRAVLASTVLSIASAGLTGVSAAAIGAAFGPAAPIAMAATGVAVGVPLAYLSRMATTQIHRDGNEHAASVGLLAKLANPSSPMADKAQVAEAIRKSWTPLEARREQQVEDLLSSKIRLKMEKMAGLRFAKGRLLLEALFTKDSNSHNVEMADLLHAEAAAQRLAYSQQRLDNLAGDRKRIDEAKTTLGLVHQAAGKKTTDSSAVIGRIEKHPDIRRVLDQVEMREQKLIDHDKPFKEHAFRLIESIKQAIFKKELAISDEDWTCIKAFLLYPRVDGEVLKQIETLEKQLSEKSLLVGSNGVSMSRRLEADLSDTKAKGFLADLDKIDSRMRRCSDDIMDMSTDHKHYREGRIDEVKDRFGIYKRALKNYIGLQDEYKDSSVFPPGYGLARMAGRLGGLGLVGGQLLLTHLGIFAGAFIPKIELGHPYSPFSETGKMGDLKLGSAVQSQLSAITVNPTAAFVASGEYTTQIGKGVNTAAVGRFGLPLGVELNKADTMKKQYVDGVLRKDSVSYPYVTRHTQHEKKLIGPSEKTIAEEVESGLMKYMGSLFKQAWWMAGGKRVIPQMLVWLPDRLSKISRAAVNDARTGAEITAYAARLSGKVSNKLTASEAQQRSASSLTAGHILSV